MLGGTAVVGLLKPTPTCLILVLSEVMDAWLAALIVTVVMGGIAAVLVPGPQPHQAATPPS